MSVTVTTTLLDPALLDEAGEIQTRAFFTDPLFEFVFADVDERRRQLPWLMRVGVGYGLRFGEVHSTSGIRAGHAVWLPPGDTNMTPERMADVGFDEAEERLSAEALSRFGAFMEHIAPIHERLMPEPHWYLMILGVDPPHQGQGIGGLLMAPILARADAGGMRCYLETAKERNVAFYRKHGFEVREEADIAQGPHVWMMARDPRPTGDA
jgi:ribosomal protein S18 acetylase RimI-like enzyme